MSTVKLIRGDTLRRSWIISDANGTPVPLSGASARLHFRNAAKDLVAQASTVDGKLVIDDTQGRIDLNLPFTDTEILQPGSYKFDIEVTYPDNRRKTYESGTLLVSEDYSHG